MTANRFALGSLALVFSSSASCGGEAIGVRSSPPDGGGNDHSGDTPEVDAQAPAAADAGRPVPKNCPAGFVLEGDACAAWIPAGSASCDFTATRMKDGRVLCPSGTDTLIYDPVAGDWSTAKGLNTARSMHTATLLADGRVLVAGGVGADGATLNSAEIFDPGDMTWHATAPMTTPRDGHAAALLPDGRLLVVGGVQGQWPNETALSSAEIFDPSTEQWTQAAGLAGPRTEPTALLMADGTVLVFGGAWWSPTQSGLTALSTAEAYDAAAGVWGSAPSLPGASGVFGFSSDAATVLPDGSVLGVGLPGVVAAVLDPARTAWRPTTASTPPMEAPIASTLPNGDVLVVVTDPYAPGPSHATTYDPAHDRWTPTVRPSGWYYGGTATLLLDGSVLAVSRSGGGRQGAERYVMRQPSQ